MSAGGSKGVTVRAFTLPACIGTLGVTQEGASVDAGEAEGAGVAAGALTGAEATGVVSPIDGLCCVPVAAQPVSSANNKLRGIAIQRLRVRVI